MDQSHFFYLRIRPANYFNTKKNFIRNQRILTRVSKTNNKGMSVFASRGRPGSNDKRGLVRVRVETLERVKEVLEHLSLYIGLAIYTALGAKVDAFILK